MCRVYRVLRVNQSSPTKAAESAHTDTGKERDLALPAADVVVILFHFVLRLLDVSRGSLFKTITLHGPRGNLELATAAPRRLL